MSTTTLHIPASLMPLSRRLPTELLAEGVSYAIGKKIKEEEKILKQAEKKIDGFKRKYRSSYQTFLHKTPGKKQTRAHQDWVEWSFWETARSRAREDLAAYSKIYRPTK